MLQAWRRSHGKSTGGFRDARKKCPLLGTRESLGLQQPSSNYLVASMRSEANMLKLVEQEDGMSLGPPGCSESKLMNPGIGSPPYFV